MEYTTLGKEIAAEYKNILIEYYKLHNLDKRTIEQLEEFDTESLLCMGTRETIFALKERIRQEKEEQ